MRRHPFMTALRRGATPGWRVFVWVLLTLAVAAVPVYAQSVLGTIRGTVTDPQGAVVRGASVLITDEATGVPRTVDTDAEGRYEAANLRPGSYRVEVITSNFKKFEQPGVVVRTSGVARVDVKLELGQMTETVTVSGEAVNNIVLESPSVAVGLDEQQLRDLPRNSRDMQSFLLLNPNVLGGSDDIQFLGGRTYGVSYVQDGQASTNAIFGTVGNSAPGLDAIGEIQVLSNSYSAEYGGLAGVVVTTKRGGNSVRGSAFYDFNSNELNALTYNQKVGLDAEELAGLRSDPNSDTHSHRWGTSLGGPIVEGKTFFFLNYEGSTQKEIYGGGRANVPTQAMRNGDFSGANFTITDPTTGEPFPGNVIPAGRIDPTAQAILNYYYPLPNAGTLSTGMGVYQQFVPETRNRHRADLRIDHEASSNDSLFLRASYQYRNPNSIRFESGSALSNLGIQDTRLDTATGVLGWTRILSPTMVNEFRIGYNFDKSQRQSRYLVAEANAAMGLETAPSLAPDQVGFPSLRFDGGSSASRPINVADGGRNADRTIKQNSFTISNNFSWVLGGHSVKVGGLFTRNAAVDGFGKGVNNHGLYRFNNPLTGNPLADMLLGSYRYAQDYISTRGDLDGHSYDWAFFAQDDWRVNQSLTLFLGLRWELVGLWNENGDKIANFVPEGEGYHVVPNQEVLALMPPGVQALGLYKFADQVGVDRHLLHADKNNFSPRVGFAWRIGGGDRTVLRGGFGLFHPTVAVQALRDLMATNQFRYALSYTGAPLAHAFSQGSTDIPLDFYGTDGVDPNIQAPDIYQYNLTLERELPGDLGLRLSYIGSTMRKLVNNRDFNTLAPSTDFWTQDDPDWSRVPFPAYHGFYMDNTANRGEGQLHAAQVELRRRWKNGFAVNVAYTYAHSTGTVPDAGNSSLGPVMFDKDDIEKDRGPDPNVVKHRLLVNSTWDIPIGKGRSHGENMPGWAEALFGGWTVSTIFQARSGNNLTPFFSSFYTTSPWNTGKPLDGVGTNFCCAWRPDQLHDPNGGGSREAFYDVTAYGMPAPGVLGNAKKGSLLGPGTWVVNFAFYKDVVKKDRFRLQLSALLDNAFNHPQFYEFYGDGFSQLDDWLLDGTVDNGVAANVGAGEIANQEGFSPGRVFRLGLRATF
jgi:outer membrane receptor protein involved in Fe transport